MKFNKTLPLQALMMVTALSAPAADGVVGTGLSRQNMDLSVKPGTDFYQYAGGGWMKQHPLTPEFTRYGQFNELNETNRKQIRSLIEQLAAAPQQVGSLGQKIGGLYRLAMDSTRRNAEGFAPIKPALVAIAAVSSRRDYQVVSYRLSARGYASDMFDMGIDADLRNAAMNLVQIGQGGLSMGERDYYLATDTATTKVRDAYRDYVKHLFAMVGNDEATAQSKMQAVMDIETRIARQSYSSTKLRDVEGNYHKMGYLDLLRDYPGIDWGNYFMAAGMPAFDSLSVGQPEPLHEVERILQEEPLERLKAYTEFKIIDGAAGMLSDDFRAAQWGFYSHVMSGAEQDQPRWKRAVGTVNGVLGEAVGRLYVEKYFPESSKQRMLTLVANLQKALGERIDAQKWMSDATKARAHEKLNNFIVKIGYPDKWRSYDGLDIDEQQSFYENVCSARRFLTADVIARKANKPTDKSEWYMTPQTINAYYNPTTNEICFPAGILQPPFFNPEADDACNYGAIGVVIGHEMTHGFDDQGAQFDKDGNLNNWWTKEDKANFEQRTRVMADYFDHIEVLPGMKANGRLTLGENIADHGGLNIAFQALQNAMKEHPLTTVDGFTPEQRFFISFGFIWAENIRPEQLRVFNKTDPHSPARWRVNGALPHIDSWYKAFNIKPGAPLYLPKKKRVDVW